MAARRVKQNPLSDAVEWWDTVDYGRNRRPVEELYFAPAPASNDKVLSHLYPSFSHAPLSDVGSPEKQSQKRVEELIAFNDGSTLGDIAVDCKLLPNGEGPPRRRQAGVLHFDGHKQGVLDQQAGWRSGSDQPWTIDGSPTRANAPRSPERRDGPAGAWRSGDSSAFSFHEDKPEHQPPLMRPGGVGRRVHPSLMPYNDGSQLTLQVFAREQLDRERHNVEAYQLGAGTGIRVEAVPRGQREEALRLARSSRRGQAGTTPTQQRWQGRRTPARACGKRSAPIRRTPSAMRAGTAPTSRRVARSRAPRPWQRRGSVSRSLSRAPRARVARVALGGGRVTTPTDKGRRAARPHKPSAETAAAAAAAQYMPNLASWRTGDRQPYRLDGSIPGRDVAAREVRPIDQRSAGETGALHAHRKHTDVAYYNNPIVSQRLIAGNTIAATADATVTEVFNAPAATSVGPRAELKSVSHAQAGLSWGEMRRNGMIQRSASELALMPYFRRGEFA